MKVYTLKSKIPSLLILDSKKAGSPNITYFLSPKIDITQEKKSMQISIIIMSHMNMINFSHMSQILNMSITFF